MCITVEYPSYCSIHRHEKLFVSLALELLAAHSFIVRYVFADDRYENRMDKIVCYLHRIRVSKCICFHFLQQQAAAGIWHFGIVYKISTLHNTKLMDEVTNELMKFERIVARSGNFVAKEKFSLMDSPIERKWRTLNERRETFLATLTCIHEWPINNSP